MTETVLRLQNFSVRTEGKTLLQDVSLELRRGELIVVTGPNGAGKTSLLRAILGELPHEGELMRNGRIGYVPQRLAFDPGSPATVLDLFALALSRRPSCLGVSHAVRTAAAAALGHTGAAALTQRRFARLSGGERQRVLLALALTPAPDLLLLDEPEAGIDLEGLELFHHVIGGLCPHCRTGILLVTHAAEGIAHLPHGNLHLENGRAVPETAC